jgi:AraC-like DNA-binding protein
VQTTINRTSFSTRDPEAAHEFFAEAYVDATWQAPVDPDTFELANVRLDAGPFQLDGMRMSARVVSTFRPEDVYYVANLRAGRLRVDQRGRDELVTAGELALSGLPGIEFTTEADDIRQEVVTISARAVHSAAGLEPGGEELPEFASIRPTGPRQARTWHAAKAYLEEVFGQDRASASPLLVGSAERLIAGLLLETFQTSPAPPDRVTGAGSSWASGTLRRSIAFIDSNAGQDIGLAEIAIAARASRRAVQHAFRRHLDMTPTAYLRRVRLDQAHRELLTADPADGLTVTEVAYRWGFSSPSRFTAYYRAMYGATPSQTLRT